MDYSQLKLEFGLHLFCFISNAVKKQPIDKFGNFEGVAQALLNFLAKNKDPVAQVECDTSRKAKIQIEAYI